MSRAYQKLRWHAKEGVKALIGVCCSCVFVVLVRLVSLFHPSPRTQKDPVQRIVILRLDHIGDVVLTSPFLRELRQASPEADITLVVAANSFQVVKECPYVDRVLPFRLSRGPTILGNLTSLPAAVSFYRQHFRHAHVDLAVVPRRGPDFYATTAIVALIGAERKVWFSTRSTRAKRRHNVGFDRFYTSSVVSSELGHEVAHLMRLLRALGHEASSARLEFWLGETDREFAAQVLGNRQRSSSPVVAMAIGAKAAKRRWPIERYIDVARHLLESHDARFVLIGAPEDSAELRDVKKVLGAAVVFDEQVTLQRVAALMERSDLFVGNDSGPMHIAAACGIPVIAISCHPLTGDPDHDNSPDRVGPWGSRSSVVRPLVPRNPCQSACEALRPHCILDVTAQQVSQAAIRELSLNSVKYA